VEFVNETNGPGGATADDDYILLSNQEEDGHCISKDDVHNTDNPEIPGSNSTTSNAYAV